MVDLGFIVIEALIRLGRDEDYLVNQLFVFNYRNVEKSED